MMVKNNRWRDILIVAVFAVQLSGCSAVNTYVQQRFKVGPNYVRPQAATEAQWIDSHDKRLTQDACADMSRWWTVFDDKALNGLITNAYEQNLTLKEAGFRILEARALLGISVGELFPQQQSLNGAYTRSANAVDPGLFPPQRYFDNWNWRFNLAWELDFWGRFRRAVIAAQDDLDASVADYDQVIVTLFADVATNYVQARTLQSQIKILQTNVEIQRNVLAFVEKRYKQGFRATELDYDQALSNLKQTEAAIPQLEVSLRNATNRLCVLMGMPPEDLTKILGTGAIPAAPVEVAVGLPAELLRRRPDVRRAERLAAAQSEQIGIAITDFYPAFSLNGSLGMNARNFSDLYSKSAFTGSVGPSFNWRLLEYGRLTNNVKFQDARFQELVTVYQQTVLTASEEAENGIVRFLRAQERSKLLDDSTAAAERAVKIVILQYEKGAVDFNRYAVIQQSLISQQTSAVGAHGEIAQGLIEIYRALGGGWESRLTGGPKVEEAQSPAEEVQPPQEGEPEEVPPPAPGPNMVQPDGGDDVDVPLDLLPPEEIAPAGNAPADVSDVFEPEEPADADMKPADKEDAPLPLEKTPRGPRKPASLDALEPAEPAVIRPIPMDEIEPKLTPEKPAAKGKPAARIDAKKGKDTAATPATKPKSDLVKQTSLVLKIKQADEPSEPD